MNDDESLKQAFMAGANAALKEYHDEEAGDESLDRLYRQWVKDNTELWPMEEINLPVRMYNALRRHGCRNVSEARRWLTPGAHPEYEDHGPDFIAAWDIRAVGHKTIMMAVEDLRKFDERVKQEVADA